MKTPQTKQDATARFNVIRKAQQDLWRTGNKVISNELLDVIGGIEAEHAALVLIAQSMADGRMLTDAKYRRLAHEYALQTLRAKEGK